MYVLTIVTAIVWPVTVLCPSVSVRASEYALLELCSRLLFTTNNPSVTGNNIRSLISFVNIVILVVDRVSTPFLFHHSLLFTQVSIILDKVIKKTTQPTV